VVLRNIRYIYYAANAAAFHRKVADDIAQFLGRVRDDITPDSDLASPEISSTGRSWYHKFLPESFAPQSGVDGSEIAITLTINPANDADGAQIQSTLNAALANDGVPLVNAASDFQFVANPTQQMTIGSSANSIGASILLVAFLAVLCSLLL
jgi:hypothetical protein